MTPYLVEFRLYGIPNCLLCLEVGRPVHTPRIEVGGYNLHDEALRFMTLPVINKDDDYHFLPLAEAREYTEVNSLTVADLFGYISSARRTTKEKKALSEDRKKDAKFECDATKERAMAKCSCGVR